MKTINNKNYFVCANTGDGERDYAIIVDENLSNIYRLYDDNGEMAEASDVDIELLIEADIIRICSNCGKPMFQGYVFDGGREYFCSEDCLHTMFSDEDWRNECDDNENSYWTEFYN